MTYKIDICSACEHERPIVNKRHFLCNSCNRSRLDSKAKKKSIGVSSKQRDIEAMYKKTCQYIDENRSRVCTGCGGHTALSHSHLISRADCKGFGFPELIYDEKNIQFHCMDFIGTNGCHKIWENPKKRDQLLDYENNMKYIRGVSEELYNRYKVKQ